jgi:putative flavoprotein involved in K+ transport
VQTDDTLYECRNVVVATGPYQAPRETPALGADVFEIHATRYRNPAQLPDGAVLVVGSGNSGLQIAEELCAAGRRVFLSVSSHERVQRRYRGKDCIWWLETTGLADATLREWQGARLSRLMTGVGGGHDIDLRRLAAAGIVLLGRVAGAEQGVLAIADGLRADIARGDESLHRWIDLPVFGPSSEAKRLPVHERGVTAEQGLYFLGLPWLHKWKSAFLFGADEDAGHLAQHMHDVR